MGVSRARFKYALRYTKHIEDTTRADDLAKDLCDNDYDGFWKGVMKLNQCNNIQANCIEGKSGENEIAIYWKDYFCKLLNTNTIIKAIFLYYFLLCSFMVLRQVAYYYQH